MSKIFDYEMSIVPLMQDSRGLFHAPFKGYFEQVSTSWSHKGVLRGLHVSPYPKWCTCLKGRLWDVVVDLRPDSPDYMKWEGVWLTGKSGWQVYVPPYCGHGFYSDEDDSMMLYAQESQWKPELEEVVLWSDPILAIDWPEKENLILSVKDQFAEPFKKVLWP